MVKVSVYEPHWYFAFGYRLMMNEGISQSILVSGESGAGKTESTKMLMRYLAYMGGRATASEGRSIEQKVLEVISFSMIWFRTTFCYFMFVSIEIMKKKIPFAVWYYPETSLYIIFTACLDIGIKCWEW